MQKLLITLLHIASWAGSAYAHRPPLGATYRRTVSLPVIGTQTVVRLAHIAQNASLTCSWPLSGPLRRRSPCVAPFLAQQLTILTRNMARLQLQGRLQLDEPVEYDITDEGKLSFALTNSTKQLLRRFRTSLDAAAYDMSDDTAHVVVWPPLPLSVTIKLQRVPSREPSKLAAAMEGARMPTFLQGLWSQKQKGSETSAA